MWCDATTAAAVVVAATTTAARPWCMKGTTTYHIILNISISLQQQASQYNTLHKIIFCLLAKYCSLYIYHLSIVSISPRPARRPLNRLLVVQHRQPRLTHDQTIIEETCHDFHSHRHDLIFGTSCIHAHVKQPRHFRTVDYSHYILLVNCVH